MINVFSMQFRRYIFLIQCIIFHYEYNYVMALLGQNVRQVNQNEFYGIAAIISLQGLNRTQIEMSQRCTAILVSRQDVLTAEHCLRRAFTEGVLVLVGSVDLCQTTEFYPMFIWTYDHWAVTRQIPATEDNDIAVLKLTANIPQNIRFLQISNIESNLLFGLNAQMVGWGKLSNETKPTILHTGIVRILTKEDCEQLYHTLRGRFTYIDERRLCSLGNPPVVIHHGDSGGPLLYFGSVIAINTGVIPGLPDDSIHDYQINYHVGVFHYRGFIQDIKFRFRINF